jgi:hypothetical protein
MGGAHCAALADLHVSSGWGPMEGVRTLPRLQKPHALHLHREQCVASNSSEHPAISRCEERRQRCDQQMGGEVRRGEERRQRCDQQMG